MYVYFMMAENDTYWVTPLKVRASAFPLNDMTDVVVTAVPENRLKI